MRENNKYWRKISSKKWSVFGPFIRLLGYLLTTWGHLFIIIFAKSPKIMENKKNRIKRIKTCQTISFVWRLRILDIFFVFVICWLFFWLFFGDFVESSKNLFLQILTQNIEIYEKRIKSQQRVSDWSFGRAYLDVCGEGRWKVGLWKFRARGFSGWESG